MRVVLDEAVFARALEDESVHHALRRIFDACRPERHALLTRPMGHDLPEPVCKWLAGEGARTRASFERVLEDGRLRASSRSRRVTTVMVEDRQVSEWQQRRLGCADAAQLLVTPLQVLLENCENDFNFLMALAPEPWRAQLQTAKTEGWLEPEHGGGLTGLKTRLEDRYTSPQVGELGCKRLLTWTMFDKDSAPDDCSKPSAISGKVVALCVSLAKEWPLGHWQLNRRSIENYLPDEALYHWMSKQGGEERDRLEKAIRAFHELERVRPEARWYLDMKDGLMGDARLSREERLSVRQKGWSLREEWLDPLFHGLREKSRNALRDGFKGNKGKVADVYERAWETIPGWDAAFSAEYAKGPGEQPSQQELLQSLMDRW